MWSHILKKRKPDTSARRIASYACVCVPGTHIVFIQVLCVSYQAYDYSQDTDLEGR